MKYDTTYYFTVTADETATVVVKLDGETLTPDADGRFAVDGTVGDHAFEIAVTGEGAARAGGFRADRGSVLILR